jgi:hypothetical protein
LKIVLTDIFFAPSKRAIMSKTITNRRIKKATRLDIAMRRSVISFAKMACPRQNAAFHGERKPHPEQSLRSSVRHHPISGSGELDYAQVVLGRRFFTGEAQGIPGPQTKTELIGVQQMSPRHAPLFLDRIRASSGGRSHMSGREGFGFIRYAGRRTKELMGLLNLFHALRMPLEDISSGMAGKVVSPQNRSKS